jgi:hypothetical protein
MKCPVGHPLPWFEWQEDTLPCSTEIQRTVEGTVADGMVEHLTRIHKLSKGLATKVAERLTGHE